MKQIVDILLCVAICLVVSCCKLEEDKTPPLEPELTLETSPELVFDTDVRESQILFYANTDWTATVPDEVSVGANYHRQVVRRDRFHYG